MNKIVGIYKITSPMGRVYVGKSTDIDKRINQYKRNTCKTQKIIHNSINKYGWESHTWEILEELPLDNFLLNEREIFWIGYYNCNYRKNKFGMNLTDGGEGSFGHKPSLRRRKQISKEKIGNKNALGYKHTPEALQKMRSKIMPFQAIEIIRKSHSDIMLNTETGIYYYGVHEAGKSINMNGNSLRDKLTGRRYNNTNIINTSKIYSNGKPKV